MVKPNLVKYNLNRFKNRVGKKRKVLVDGMLPQNEMIFHATDCCFRCIFLSLNLGSTVFSVFLLLVLKSFSQHDNSLLIGL